MLDFANLSFVLLWLPFPGASSGVLYIIALFESRRTRHSLIKSPRHSRGFTEYNKDNSFSGPQALAHYTDVKIDGERGRNDEVIFSTSTKNRLGPTGLRAVFRMTEKGLCEKEEPETGYILRHLLPVTIGLAPFVTPTKHGLTVDEITVAKSQNAKLILVGGAGSHAAFIAKIIQDQFPDFQTTFIVNANFTDKIGKAAELAIAIALLSAFYQKPIPRDIAFASSLDAFGRLLPLPDMGPSVKRANDQGYTRVIWRAPDRESGTFLGGRRYPSRGMDSFGLLGTVSKEVF